MSSTQAAPRGRVLGIGGIFFKSKDADAEGLRSWYQDKLGIKKSPHGTMFPWKSCEGPETEHVTVWSIFPSTSKYLDPGSADFMINYIVDDLDALLENLNGTDVKIDPKREDHEYGRFAWIYDPQGRKIELWQPPASNAS